MSLSAAGFVEYKADLMPEPSVSKTTPSRQSRVITDNPILLALVGWLVPGLGYGLIGERVRMWVVLIGLALCFWLGALIGGLPNIMGPVVFFGDQLRYASQLLCGGHTLLAEVVKLVLPNDPTGGEAVDVGQTFTIVAGLLNLLVIVDTLSRATPPTTPKSGGSR